MFLRSSQLTEEDLRHLYCTDPQLADEIAAVHRSLQSHREVITGWLNVDHESALEGKEVPLCQQR